MPDGTTIDRRGRERASWRYALGARPLLSLLHLSPTLLAVILGALAWWYAERPAYARPDSLSEPPPAAAFMAAYARGDEAAAERLASPLYRTEWERRGLSVQDRLGLLPRWFRDSRRLARSTWLRFDYTGGVADADGVAHLLYTGRCVCPEQRGPLPFSVWRVDTDPTGRVLWLEMVWLFDERTQRLRTVGSAQRADALPLPLAVGQYAPRVALGVESAEADGPREGYYALRFEAAPAAPATAAGMAGQAPEAGSVLFLGIDPDGQARPGAWSYGAAPRAS